MVKSNWPAGVYIYIYVYIYPIGLLYVYVCNSIYILVLLGMYIYIYTVNRSRSVYLMIISRVLLRIFATCHQTQRVFRLTSQSAEVPKDVEKGSGS
jgi:hypothetical protein